MASYQGFDVVKERYQQEITTIDMARDFSPTPLGRHRSQGRFSGQAFREDLLKPALERAYIVRVDLDGVTGLSTGVLDEAFGGLVRDRTLKMGEFFERVKIIATRDPGVVDEVRAFVSRADQQLSAH